MNSLKEMIKKFLSLDTPTSSRTSLPVGQPNQHSLTATTLKSIQNITPETKSDQESELSDINKLLEMVVQKLATEEPTEDIYKNYPDKNAIFSNEERNKIRKLIQNFQVTTEKILQGIYKTCNVNAKKIRLMEHTLELYELKTIKQLYDEVDSDTDLSEFYERTEESFLPNFLKMDRITDGLKTTEEEFCILKQQIHQSRKSGRESEWIEIDNSLTMLFNDFQELLGKLVKKIDKMKKNLCLISPDCGSVLLRYYDLRNHPPTEEREKKDKQLILDTLYDLSEYSTIFKSHREELALLLGALENKHNEDHLTGEKSGDLRGRLRTDSSLLLNKLCNVDYSELLQKKISIKGLRKQRFKLNEKRMYLEDLHKKLRIKKVKLEKRLYEREVKDLFTLPNYKQVSLIQRKSEGTSK